MTRPACPEAERKKARALQIALLKDVDHVVIAPFATLPEILAAVRPSAYIKGMDTATTHDLNDVETVELRPELNAEFAALPSDARIVIFADDGSVSTSAIVNRIKGAPPRSPP